jgi:microcystin-dependent protein
VPISENETLFQLIGTTYGGDGQSTFGLPDLQGRLPVHMGTNAGTTVQIGEKAGVETVTLLTQQIPSHNHALQATASGQQLSPQNAIYAVPSSSVQGLQTYAAGTPATPLVPASIQNAGGNQPHNNIQPYLCVSFIISLFGIFPSQT